MKKRIDKALELFSTGYNCSQAVIGAYAKDLGLDENTAMKMAGAFGGGMRCGEVCGGVTGALMALGLKYGQESGDDQDAKANCNNLTIRFMDEYVKRNKSYLCKELLGFDVRDEEKREQNKETMQEVCPNAIVLAIEILEEIGM